MSVVSQYIVSGGCCQAAGERHRFEEAKNQQLPKIHREKKKHPWVEKQTHNSDQKQTEENANKF